MVAQMSLGMAARGGAAGAAGRGPMGAMVPQAWVGKLGNAQRIGRGDLVQGDNNNAGRAASGLANLAKVLGPTVGALAALPKVAHALSNRFLEAQRNLAQYNGTIATSLARLEVGRIGRDIRSGGMTAGTTRELADSTNRLEESLQPIGNLTTNIKHVFADALNEAAIFLLNGVNTIVNPVAEALFEQEKPKPAEFQLFLDNRRNEWLDEQKKKREPALNLNRPNGN